MDFLTIVLFVGFSSMIHAFLVAIKPIITRVIVMVVLLSEFRLIVNADIAPQSLADGIAALTSLFVGIFTFIIIVPIILCLEKTTKHWLDMKSPKGKDRDRLTCFGPLRVRLFGLLKSLPG